MDMAIRHRGNHFFYVFFTCATLASAVLAIERWLSVWLSVTCMYYKEH